MCARGGAGREAERKSGGADRAHQLCLNASDQEVPANNTLSQDIWYCKLQTFSFHHFKLSKISFPDDRVVEYGFQEVLFRQRSPHQLVEIVETTDFGRILILDGLVNLAENDTEPYTHTLMNLPNEDYKVEYAEEFTA